MPEAPLSVTARFAAALMGLSNASRRSKVSAFEHWPVASVCCAVRMTSFATPAGVTVSGWVAVPTLACCAVMFGERDDERAGDVRAVAAAVARLERDRARALVHHAGLRGGGVREQRR